MQEPAPAPGQCDAAPGCVHCSEGMRAGVTPKAVAGLRPDAVVCRIIVVMMFFREFLNEEISEASNWLRSA